MECAQTTLHVPCSAIHDNLELIGNHAFTTGLGQLNPDPMSLKRTEDLLRKMSYGHWPAISCKSGKTSNDSKALTTSQPESLPCHGYTATGHSYPAAEAKPFNLQFVYKPCYYTRSHPHAPLPLPLPLTPLR